MQPYFSSLREMQDTQNGAEEKSNRLPSVCAQVVFAKTLIADAIRAVGSVGARPPAWRV